MDPLDAKRFYVFGVGKSGAAVSALLVENGHEVVAFDDDPDAGASLDKRVRVASSTQVVSDIGSSDCLVVSPGVPLDNEIVATSVRRGATLVGEIEIAYRFIESQIVAVTGTNGKSTTVGVIGAILARAGRDAVVAGNIGCPLSDVARRGSPEVVVLEVSSFQLDTIRDFRADVSVLLNVTPDHLDRYGASFDSYAASKARIINGAGRDTFYVYNAADGVAASLAKDYPGFTVPFSLERIDDGVFFDGASIVVRRNGFERTIARREDFSPQGVHNLENALAAVASCIPFDVTPEATRTALREYRPLPHRMELVRVIGGVAYVNDSKATNVDAAAKSLQSIDGKAVVILGGRDKDGDFAALREFCDGIRVAVLIGEAAPAIRAALGGFCELIDADDMDSALTAARKAARPGDTVLLAPACASFDMFANYEARGEAFRRSVARLND